MLEVCMGRLCSCGGNCDGIIGIKKIIIIASYSSAGCK